MMDSFTSMNGSPSLKRSATIDASDAPSSGPANFSSPPLNFPTAPLRTTSSGSYESHHEVTPVANGFAPSFMPPKPSSPYAQPNNFFNPYTAPGSPGAFNHPTGHAGTNAGQSPFPEPPKVRPGDRPRLAMKTVDYLFLVYFLVHIPITLLIDSQCVLPATLFPEWARELLEWHIKTNGDYLVGGCLKGEQGWFSVLIYNELIVQLPLFLICSYALFRCRPWARQLIIVYGVHATTCMLSILGDMIASGKAGGKMPQLVGAYVAWLLIPLWMTIRMLKDSTPFETPLLLFKAMKVE